METSPEKDNWYVTGGCITVAITFIAIFIQAIDEWGLLFGLMFGWIPALIGALLLGFLWPLAVLVVLYFIIQIL